MVLSAMFLAIGLVLPFLTGQIPQLGSMLLPMHLPVLLCGFICGPAYGLLCGMLLPMLNCMITGMPAPFPMLPIMFCELAVYGLVSGLLFSKTPLGKLKYGIYIALPIAMLCGRIAYAVAFYSLLLTVGEFKALSVSAAVVSGLPGILIQLLLIPPIILMIRKNKM